MPIITPGKCNLAIEVGGGPILEYHYVLYSKLFDNIVSYRNHALNVLLPLVFDNSGFNMLKPYTTEHEIL